MYNIENLIHETKQFWKISNFRYEILEWIFDAKIDKKTKFVIGHPMNSHKGSSLGDILPYTILPFEIKQKYPDSTVYVPSWFSHCFENNPYIDGIDNSVERWGSLGTWGTTVQRTSNVWGIQSKSFSPCLYVPKTKTTNTIIFCTNSKTGGTIPRSIFIDIIEIFKKSFHCIQLATSNDDCLPNIDRYIFNCSYSDLVELINSAHYYIGAQNSIYHLAKSLKTPIIGILPQTVDPRCVILPFLTQVNYLELEMLSDAEKYRATNWYHWAKNCGLQPEQTHHIGWLYPDTVHLTTSRNFETIRCPFASPHNVLRAINNDIYPFNESKLYDVYLNSDLWCDGD